MKTKFLLLGFLLLVTTMLKAQQIATVRINEVNTKDDSKISVVYENGQTEIIPLEGWKLSISTLTSYYEASERNQKTITEFLNKMISKGYTLTTTMGTTLYFIKK